MNETQTKSSQQTVVVMRERNTESARVEETRMSGREEWRVVDHEEGKLL